MSADEFQQLWRSYEQKLQRSMKLNVELIEADRSRKMRAAFRWQIAFKIMMVGLAVAFNVFVGGLLWEHLDQPAFVLGAAIVLCCNGYGIGGYFLQILLLLQINMSDSILGTQKQLAQLEAIIIRTMRVIFLQFPAWTFITVTWEEIRNGGAGFWAAQIAVTTASVLAAIWLYRHITVERAGRPGWLKKMVDNEGGKTIARARQFMREIEEFRKEEGV